MTFNRIPALAILPSTFRERVFNITPQATHYAIEYETARCIAVTAYKDSDKIATFYYKPEKATTGLSTSTCIYQPLPFVAGSWLATVDNKLCYYGGLASLETNTVDDRQFLIFADVFDPSDIFVANDIDCDIQLYAPVARADSLWHPADRDEDALQEVIKPIASAFTELKNSKKD